MTKEEIIEMARQGGVRDDENIFEFSQFKYLEAFAKLVAEHERKKIKHFLTATSVSVQTRVYIGDEEISMLKMTHEEIRARGQE
jgi:hypothetical protein